MIGMESAATKQPSTKLNVKLDRILRDGDYDRVLVTSHVDKAKLAISFKQTIRVADNSEVEALPPGFGNFPLFNVNDYRSKLPPEMLAKGGIFLPIYQREALWIKFDSNHEFMIKIYTGGINAVSGESADEDTATKLRRAERLSQQELIQDYIVTPDQMWLNGFATANGLVRQFVAMPKGTGYSVEAQITGDDQIGGIQFEITPSKYGPAPLPQPASRRSAPKPPKGSPYHVFVKTLAGNESLIFAGKNDTIDTVKLMIEDQEGVPRDEQRLLSGGKQLEDGRTLMDYNIPNGGSLHLVLRLRGGGCPPEMRLAAGGLIRQTIEEDTSCKEDWAPEATSIFNVEMLNSDLFRHVTGREPPPTPINAQTYAEYGLPYYHVYDEGLSGIHGDFDNIKSVNEIDHEKSDDVAVASRAEVDQHTNNPVIILDPVGQTRPFRHMSDLIAQVASLAVS